VRHSAAKNNRRIESLTAEAMQPLEQYAWPGNVRELENAIERAVALERTPAVLPESLPDAVRAAGAAAVSQPGTQADDLTLEDGFDLEQHVQGIERDYIFEALRRSQGVKKNAAELLGLSFRQFRYLLKKYNIQ
jgi:two-component system response regulator PilR (NtrC family)